MAGPFVYVPEASSSAYQPYPYYATATPQGAQTPFLPPSPLLYPTSPFLAPADIHHTGTPGGAFNPNSVLWPEESSWGPNPYGPQQPPAGYVRQRTRSWAGPAPPQGSPFLTAAPPPAFLHAQSFSPGHRRANSHGAATIPPWVQPQPYPPNQGYPATANPYPYAPFQPPVPQQIHPLLNGDAPSPDFHFDLALAAFVPLRRHPHNPAQSMPIPHVELGMAAFHPPRTALRILHPQLPFWPVDIAARAPNPNPYQPQAPPSIALGDILIALHRALHQRITHADWATLNPAQEQAVTHTFAARCHTEAARSGAPVHALRDVEMSVRSQGVKKVDFLLGRTVVRGLTRVPGDPDGVVRLVTA
ncbi:hypothetical protein C8F01DRAFT_1177796 [Mycena amicta]|nr:hypothetical protein C8F01DRAFT_1177796 [Mycena amicta]